jgi:Concanavalin A-like lectin/glucanases superfamily
MFTHRQWICASSAALAFIASTHTLCLHAAQSDFAAAVVATHPVAYYRLDATTGKSQAGTTTYSAKGGVTSGSPGAAIAGSSGNYAKFDGTSGYILSTQKGGVGQTSSIMAWVNLADLPSKVGHYFYVAGESENGNDLDLQFETDNILRFFTASGGNLQYKPPADSLLNQWHMIVATLDTASHTRALYWDGKLVAHDGGGGQAGKTAPFSIGASTVFSGRWFKGGIEEVALWNRPLQASEVSSIYAASGASASTSATGSATGAAPTPTTGPFATKADVDIEDSKGKVNLKREEQIAYMFLSAIEVTEHECQLDLQHACTMDQMLSGSYPAGSHIEHLKFDPNKTDPNYTYTLAAGGMAWEAHANAKKPGLLGFCFMARDVGTVIVTIGKTGKAGWVDDAIGNRGMSGDSFATQ